jgi:hypothetical protein
MNRDPDPKEIFTDPQHSRGAADEALLNIAHKIVLKFNL